MRLFFVCFLLLFQSPLFSKDKLIFSIDVVRHGDRTPIHAIPALPYPWKEKTGQLTENGMKNHFNIGKKFRTRYMDQEKLLSPHYVPDEIKVLSTDYDRTLMSAQALLMGLYPIGSGPLPGGYQPIPIHVKPKECDTLLSNEIHEEAFHELLKKYVFPSKEWVAQIEATKGKWPEWSHATNWKIENLTDVIRLGNALYIYRLYNVPLPLPPQEVENIIRMSKWGVAEKYKPKEIGEFLGAEDINLIRDYLTSAKGDLKYVLISAHDSTLLSMMSALGVPLPQAPHYGDYINFSIYENEKGERRIDIHYNNRLIFIPKCAYHACTLNEF